MSPRMVGIRLLRIRFFQVLPQDIAMRCAELFSRYNWLIAQATEPVREIRLHAAMCIEVPFVIAASSQKTIQTKPFSCRRFFAAISTEPLCPALCIPLSLLPTHRLFPLLSFPVVGGHVSVCHFRSALFTFYPPWRGVRLPTAHTDPMRFVPIIALPVLRALLRSPLLGGHCSSPFTQYVSVKRSPG